jgi:hypothetical protein
MIVRVWSTAYAPGRIEDFIAFGRDRLEPLFHSFGGCCACFFTYDAMEWRTITFWRDQAALDAAKETPIYREMLTDLVGSGLLIGDQRTKMMTYAGGGIYGSLSD